MTSQATVCYVHHVTENQYKVKEHKRHICQEKTNALEEKYSVDIYVVQSLAKL